MKSYGLEMNDNQKIKLGSGSDIELYFDGTDLYIKSTSGDILFKVNSTEDALQLIQDGLSGLYYNGSARIKTAATGIQFSDDGNNWSGIFEMGQVAPSGVDVLGYNGYMYASRVYNAIYVDIADFHVLNDKLVHGKCYYDTPEGAKICTKKCQKSMIGMASDTYGFGIGAAKEGNVPIAIGGWVLAYVDKEYEPGTVLTNDKNGSLTKMKWWQKLLYPERMVGIYHKKEKEEIWGPIDSKIKVDNRHWIKIK